jgi:hypothetical protein
MITHRSPRTTSIKNTVLTVIMGAALVAGLALAGPAAAREPEPATFTNAISESFADTFADPSVILGKDGWWYAYSTADPLKAGDPSGIMHIARTKDWITWEYQGTVFNASNRPSWAAPNSFLWAPDIRYIQGKYVLYYTVIDTVLNPGEDEAIGVATAPTPTGPWTPTDAPVIAPRPRDGTFLGTIDPAGFTDVDGTKYLYFGGYHGGIWASKVSADGLTATTEPVQVAIDNRYEGGYVIRRDGWYYLMGSSANCCAGPTTGYSVFAGRSKSPLGPFVDADGIPLLASAVGGTTVITQNGNRWIGAGHHAIATDTEGRDFIVYHAIDRDEPWLTSPFGINRRPMLLDRLDWIDGWPRTRAGAGPSEGPQPAPLTGSGLGIDADDPAARGFTGLQAGPDDDQAGATALVDGTARTKANAPAHRARVRFDFRTDKALTTTLGAGPQSVRVTVDPAAKRLQVTAGPKPVGGSAILDPTAGWQTLIIEVDRSEVTVSVSESDLADPRAEVRLDATGLRLRSAPVVLDGDGALIDNLSVRSVAVQARSMVATPKTGALLWADEFDDGELDGWNWLRKDPQAKVVDGEFTWPLQAGDLVGTANNAGALLRTPPKGPWIVETKVELDLGTDTVRNYQQAGLVIYRNDDDLARLCSVAIWNTRQVEYGRELVDDGRLSYGAAMIGTPAKETWFRVAYHRNAAGEHLYRAASSRDGEHWTWGATWVLPAGEAPRIGLVAHGGATPATVASFDYLRFYAVG